MINNVKVGVAIACHNAESIIFQCLKSLQGFPAFLVIFDDGSNDNTVKICKSLFPNCCVIKGNGNAWWAGGTAEAIKVCFANSCDYALMLNPDCIINKQSLKVLVKEAHKRKNSIVAGVCVDSLDPSKIVWAGSERKYFKKFLIETSQYIFKPGQNITDLPKRPFTTDEVHGRGVLISKEVYKIIGTLDFKNFPHYGADNDYSYRAKKAKIKMFIIPEVIISLLVNNSGMKKTSSLPFSFKRFKELIYYLFDD